MRFFLIPLILFPLLVSCQKNTFKYSDNSFAIGSIHTLQSLSYTYWKRPQESDKSTLDSLYTFLEEHPNIHVEVGNHTSSYGGENYNLKFSQKTAEYIVNWLINKGINGDRLKALGYGSSQPEISKDVISKMENQDSKDKAHAKNSRIEIKIIKTKEE